MRTHITKHRSPVTLCGESVDEVIVAMRPEQATCQECRERKGIGIGRGGRVDKSFEFDIDNIAEAA